MSSEKITLILAFWGTISGTVAILVQLASFFHDRARLKVQAVMSYGSNKRLARLQGYYIETKLTNRGRRIIRIHRIAVRISHPIRVAVNRIAFHLRLTSGLIQDDIGIYAASTDPIDEMFSDPNVKHYPPRNLTIEEHETKEIDLIIAEAILPLFPEKKAVLIVTDQIGRRYKAEFCPLDVRKEHVDEV